MTRLRADLLLLVAAALWGIAFYFQKEAMAHVGVFTFIAARCALAVLALSPLALIEHGRASSPLQPAAIRTAAWGALAFLLAAGLQQEAITTATVTNTGFLTALYVVFTPLVAWVVTRRAPAPLVWPAIALSFLGIWLLGGGTLGGLSPGDQLAALCAVFWAVHVVVTGLASRFDRPFGYTCLQFAFVALAAGLVAAAFETPTLAGLKNAAADILYVGLVATALTFTILVIALRHTTAAEAMVLLAAESLFSAAAGAAFLGERLSLVSWTGAGLIVAAVLLVQVAARFKTRASPAAASG